VFAAIALLLSVPVCAQPAAGPAFGVDESYRNEIRHAISRGIRWLEAHQHTNGWWSTPDQPAVTALALLAWQGDPARAERGPQPAWIRQAYRYIEGCVQPDGGIHRTNLVTYNTSLCLMALLAAQDASYDPTILKARSFLVRLQRDLGTPGVVDTPFDGGVGYGSKYDHSDMGNTVQALEAIFYAKSVLKGKEQAEAAELNWPAALHFLQSCQNLPTHNPESWASDDPKMKGGFVYYPGHSMAGSVTNAVTGRVALRSYGSVSYAGLLSYIYADLKQEDPRVQAVLEWLRGNYTLEENPGMGQEGLFYYFHTMAKALSILGMRDLELRDGRRVNWRRVLSQRVLNLQDKDGSWSNPNNRWWEKDPCLTTAYCVLTLERLWPGL
jgi:squalene-hopene/tetraprenyl-beta-curcumene cyclase